jgi:hypothetical protein
LPNDDLVIAKPKSDDSASGILADLLEGGFAALLDDKDIKHACLKELADVGCRAPANHVVWFCVRKLASAAEGFVSETLKSKFIDIMEANPAIAGVLRRISNLKSAEKDKNALKQKLLEDLNATTADDEAMMAEMTTELEVVAALHTRSALQGLSGQIADLAKEIGATLETVLRDMTEPQLLTAGINGNWERDSDNLSVAERLKYNSGKYGFYGRERELDVLGNFLHQIDPAPGLNRFRWLLLTGAGGEGKSRLALEFSKNHVPVPWLAGKLELDELRIMVSGQFKWRPRRPTLFVIDYPAQAPEAVNMFLRMLDRDWKEFDLPVRVLLLEREASGEWFKTLVPENSAGAALNDHVFGTLREGFPVWPLMPDAIVTLMNERFELEGMEAPEPFLLLQAAYKIDPRAAKIEEGILPLPRALFASAVAEVMVEATRTGEVDLASLIAGLTQHEILDRLVDSDRTNRWVHACGGDDERRERHENLLAFATMCLGLSRQSLNSPEARGLRTELLPQSVSSPLINAMGSSLPDQQIAALEPDILGEHYALSRLEKLREHGFAQDMIDAAFSLGGEDFAIFCLRCLRDFADRSKALELFLPSEMVTPAGASIFARLCVDLSNHFGEDYDSVQLNTIFARLDALKKAFTDKGEIALNEAAAAVNVTGHAGKAGDWSRVEAMFARLDALKQALPGNVGIAVREARAAFNAINHASQAGDWPRVEAVFARLDTLKQALPENHEIALQEAKAAVNLTHHAGEAGDGPRVDAMFVRFDLLRQAFPDNGEIALEEAKAAVNVIGHAGEAGGWPRVDAMFGRFDLLKQAFPDNGEIALEEASAAVNAIILASEASEWPRVEAIFARFDVLRQAFPDNGKIALNEAEAAVNVTHDAGKAGDWLRVDAMIDRFDLIRQAFPDNGEIALEEAKAAVNVISLAGETGDWPRVDATFARFDLIRQAFPDNDEIALREARATVNVIGHAGEVGDWLRVEAVYQRVFELAQADISNKQVVGICGRAVSMRYAAYRRAGRPPNEEAASEAASGAQAGIINAIAQESSVGVATCLMVIKDAQRRFPDEENIAEVYKWGAEAGIDWEQAPDFDA